MSIPKYFDDEPDLVEVLRQSTQQFCEMNRLARKRLFADAQSASQSAPPHRAAIGPQSAGVKIAGHDWGFSAQPLIYDISTDERRLATQADVDRLVQIAAAYGRLSSRFKEEHKSLFPTKA